MDGGIYTITNKETGAQYVGSASRIRARWNVHRSQLRRGCHHSVYLQRSWDKHGESSFEFEVVETCDSSALIEREQFWMGALRPKYNTEPIAGSRLGRKATEETTQRQRVAQTGKTRSPESRARIAETNRRSREDPTWIEKVREGCKRRSQSPEWIKNNAAARKRQGKPKGLTEYWTPERRAAHGEQMRGRKRSQETCDKVAAGLRGRVVPQETRLKISATLTGRPLSPEHRKKLSDARRKVVAMRKGERIE